MIGSTRLEYPPHARKTVPVFSTTARLKPAGNEVSIISKSRPMSSSRTAEGSRDELSDSSTCSDAAGFFMDGGTRTAQLPRSRAIVSC